MIAPDFRENLMTALEGAVRRLNSGMGPDESVAKAASAAGFNMEQAKRLCETFNTARTLYHFETRPGEKEASFPLANQQRVLQLVFAGEARPAAKAACPLASAEYAGTEKAAKDGRLTQDEFDGELWPKSAQDECDLPPVEVQAERVRRVVGTMEDLGKQAQSEANQADIVISQHLAKLAADIAQDFDLNGHEKYARLWAAYSGTAPMLRKLAQFLPTRVGLTANQLSALGNVIETRDLRAWAGTLTATQKLAEHAANTRAAGIQMLKEAGEFAAAFEARLQQNPFESASAVDRLLAPDVKAAQTSIGYKVPTYRVTDLLAPTPTDPSAIKRQQELSTADVKKTIGPGMVDTLSEGVNKGLGDAASDYVQTGLSSILGAGATERDNKRIVERLRNQQRETLLQDLLVNDPFISEADPRAVANAYQAVMTVAPEVSTQKEVVRAFLRQALQSVAVGPYEAASVADLEKTVREIQGTLPARAAGPEMQGGKKK